MTDLDELRRIAYGRTTGPDEEAAAALARVELATHESERLDAARRVEPVEAPAVEETAEHADDPGEDDEPGYLRRLAASWRAWIVPAAVAFVAGIGVAAASFFGYAGLMTTEQTSAITPGTNTSERFQEGSTVVEIPEAVPGDVEAAQALFERAQEPDDVITTTPDPMVIPESTRLLVTTPFFSGYAGLSQTGEVCVMIVDASVGTGTSCAPFEGFADTGVSVGFGQSIGRSTQMSWDGNDVTITMTTD
ncbi:hypothetical protein HD599_000587 [Conyzicola lurida]|uniref:Uncharacterized protein n=1 Tax=Conyzicola lurida TaxID=1172621 RepID=A0A841AIJ1_9MICO|nr:hypothetical protein [Conyzicola lurida]MBB5842264.1 hypothetical protein [Conyzicola lurida]